MRDVSLISVLIGLVSISSFVLIDWTTNEPETMNIRVIKKKQLVILLLWWTLNVNQRLNCFLAHSFSLSSYLFLSLFSFSDYLYLHGSKSINNSALEKDGSKQMNRIEVRTNEKYFHYSPILTEKIEMFETIAWNMVELFLNFDWYHSYSFEVFEEISNYTKAIIEDSSYVDIFINQVSRHWMSEIIINFVKPHDAIYNVPQAILVSYSTPEQIVKLFRCRSISNIIKGTLQIKSDSIVSQSSIKKSLKGFQCSDTLQGILYRESETPEWNPLPVYFFERFFHILSYIMIIAAIILFFELIHDYSQSSADHVTVKLRDCTTHAQIKIVHLKWKNYYFHSLFIN